MNINTSSKQIPWEYTSTMEYQIWKWVTEHFTAMIRTTVNPEADALAQKEFQTLSGESSSPRRGMYSSVITDVTRGRKQIILNEIAFSFDDAAKQILETVGKAYPVTTNYREYAGDLATTFTIADGRRINFGPLEGTKVVLTVNTEHGPKKITGSLLVKNYKIEIVVESGGKAVIPPFVITEVDTNGKKRLEDLIMSESQHDRTVKGVTSMGCTGKAGYFEGTVDHPFDSRWCPVHNV